MSSVHEILRKEASAVSFLELTESQRKAVDSLSEFLRQALEMSDKAPDDDRRSRVVLVSGMKGCGKTSLVHSLRKLMESREVYTQFGGAVSKELKEVVDNSNGNATPNKRRGVIADFISLRTKLELRFGNDFHKDERRIIWLDPLYLDPITPGTNLTAALLARVHAHATKEERGGRGSGLLDPITHVEKAKHALENLQSSAVMSLEGNLEQRAAAVDPDAFAVNAMDAEKQKLLIARTLNDALGSLAAGAAGNPSKTKGLFVLPVDDMDVRPSRAVEMLKLATLLQIPRLFFLFLGEYDAIDQILFYQTQGEYIRLLGDALARRDEVSAAVEAKSNEIASSLLRKMLPPAQRLSLEPMTLGEALLYPYGLQVFDPSNEKLRKNKDTLHQVLAGFRLPGSSVWSKAEENADASTTKNEYPLHQIFIPDEAVEPKSGEERAQWQRLIQKVSWYDAAHLLAGPPRQVADLWAELRVLRDKNGAPETRPAEDEMPKASAAGVIAILVNTLKRIVDEDPNPGVPVQRALKIAATPPEKTSAKLWELAPPDIRVVSTFGDRLEFVFDLENHKNEPLPMSCIVGQEVMVHELWAKNPHAAADVKDAFRMLGDRSRVAYKATHDLMRLTGQGVVTKNFEHFNRRDMAYTMWDDGEFDALVIPWSSIEWPTFWHQDLYRSNWNKGMAAIRKISNERADLKGADLALLMLIYRVAATIATAMSRPGHLVSMGERLVEPNNVSIGQEHDESGKKLTNPEKTHNPWRFEHLGIEKNKAIFGDKPQEIQKYVVTKRAQGEDDAEADLLDAVLLDIALLATPEVMLGIGQPKEAKKKDEYQATRVSIHKKVRDELVTFAANLFGTGDEHNRNALLPYYHRLRLDRIGAHIGTSLGLNFVWPEAKGSRVEAFQSTLSGTMGELAYLAIPESMTRNHFKKAYRRAKQENKQENNVVDSWEEVRKMIEPREPSATKKPSDDGK